MAVLIRWFPATACAAAIFWLSHQSAPPGTGWGPDYLGHFLVYGALAATLTWGVTDRFRHPLTGRGLVWVIALATLYGISDEFHQSFVPDRTPSALDVLADAVGAALVASLLFWRFGRRAGSRLNG